jgi:hypothetical protein
MVRNSQGTAAVERETQRVEIMIMVKLSQKKVYVRPSIEDHGKVAEVTATGLTKPGGDAKSGSVASQGV